PAAQPNPNAVAFLADVEDALKDAAKSPLTIPTSFRNDALPNTPTIGDTPPVEQPGRPAMSKTASDVSGIMIASSVPIIALGAAATGVLWGSGHANPEVIGWICAGVVAVPAAITAPILALKSLMKSAKETVQAAPPVIHQHYSGTVVQDQRTVNTNTSGVWAHTRNQLPK
ncbi:hypothetical protein DMH12_15550, partial [Streptomyces sp. WAC 04229]|uniref:hypothetical protein n=1 Tax=Streptomyces sp. WAC 04229 TaxID=2203206 RepID=UPI0010025B56